MHRLTKVKNTTLALRAMTFLPEHYRLVILGDGPERRRLEREARRIGLGERARFLGFVDDVRPFIEDADVLVHPSLAETYCLAAFEAAQRSIPVVCLSQGSLVDSVPHHVVGVSLPISCSPEDFAFATQEAAEVDSESSAFRRAKEARRELSPASVLEKWQQLLDGLA